MRHDLGSHRSPLPSDVSKAILRNVGRLWSRRRVLFLWVTIMITWALFHFIHGSQHPELLDSISDSDGRDGIEMNHRVTDPSTWERINSLRTAAVDPFKWHVDNISESEENMLRGILQAAERGSEDYTNSESLKKFWDSVDHAGSEKEEDGSRSTTTKSGRIKAKDLSEEQLLQEEAKTFESRKIALEDKATENVQPHLETINNPTTKTSQNNENSEGRNKADKQDGQDGRFESFLALQRDSDKQTNKDAEVGKEDDYQNEKVETHEIEDQPEEEPWEEPHKKWKRKKECATVEEMGQATVGDTRKASLKIRNVIHQHFIEHGEHFKQEEDNCDLV